ncbi:mitotic spindle assembly checkpoint protein MAD2B isoform X2 [Amazona aestiva]|uniref:Mitotic spindle assembly checkpoint protein MAD2B n=1 Tax=Amazona aestiva TaxID=12930 RepID=A0A0Q3XA69_AMAAE|nr:mitotic spindle assembly checkpoint protein MAD2B isoform X2 [Amazona aestiva]
MTTLTRQDLNFGQVVADVLSEFLEVAVHLILYVREVYPIGIFQKRKKYNVPVQMSCHPELNQYIQDTLHCVKPLLEKNDVEKVVVVILDKEHHPVERFVFEITQPPLLSISSESLLSHVEQLLRAFILKISVCDASSSFGRVPVIVVTSTVQEEEDEDRSPSREPGLQKFYCKN